MISHTRLPLFSRAYVEKIGEPGDEAPYTSLGVVAMEHIYVFYPSRDFFPILQCLQSPMHGEDESMSDSEDLSSSYAISRAQLELAQAWSCFLLVISTAQEALLQGSTLRLSSLKELLAALESQLAIQTSPTETVVAIATELSMLYTVLLRRWSCDLSKLDEEMLPSFNRILQLAGQVDPALSIELHAHLYSGLIQVIRTAKAHKGTCRCVCYFHICILPPLICK